MAVHKIVSGMSIRHNSRTTQKEMVHTVSYDQSKTGLWYVICECGKRSKPVVSKESAEKIGERHEAR